MTYVYPAKISINVLFPAPLGPIMAVSSPDLNSPFKPFRIVLFSANMKQEKKKLNLIETKFSLCGVCEVFYYDDSPLYTRLFFLNKIFCSERNKKRKFSLHLGLMEILKNLCIESNKNS